MLRYKGSDIFSTWPLHKEHELKGHRVRPSVCLHILSLELQISIKFFVIVKGFLLNLILIASSQIELEFFQLLFVKYIFMTLNIDHTEI
jgi:hypothetical protein